jgi:hypothetical protein
MVGPEYTYSEGGEFMLEQERRQDMFDYWRANPLVYALSLSLFIAAEPSESLNV